MATIQFATPITFFPSERNQQKYQFRYDISECYRRHALKFGVNLIHEPVLGGCVPRQHGDAVPFPQNPAYYLRQSGAVRSGHAAGASTSHLGGGFSQNIQRLALYAQDSWRVPVS